MAINTNQINPNAFGYTPTFPEGADGLTSFISGFQGARDAGKDEQAAIAKAEAEGKPAPKPSYFNRFRTGVLDAPGVRAEGADPFAKAKAMDFQQRLATGAVEFQGKMLENKLKTLALTATLEDQRTMETLMDGMAANPNLLNEIEAPPVFKTPQYQGVFNKLAEFNRTSMITKTRLADATAFTKRLSAIDPADRADIQGMEGNKDGSISSMQWKALGLSEERAQVAKDNARALAEMEALQRGDVPTTTITDKGVSTTYKPAPKDASDAAPKTMTLDGGTTIAWVPGSKAIHVIKDGNKKEFTPFQLQSIAKGLPDKDPRKKQISDFLADTAVAQSSPKPNATSEPKTPEQGEVRQGYRFKGGDPSDQNSWEKAQ